MQVGIIAPVSTLEKYCTTEIQYCLPFLIANDKGYRSFYNLKKEEGHLVIMDTHRDQGWERKPEEMEVILEALSYLTPSLIITPSHMFQTTKTVEAARLFLSKLSSRKVKPEGIVGCVEGTTVREVKECAKDLKKLGITTLAIPSHLYKICKEIPHNGPTIYIENHLNPEELDGLEGTLVTSLPVRLGLLGRLNSDYLPSPNSLTFKEEDKFPKVIEKNIRDLIAFYAD